MLEYQKLDLVIYKADKDYVNSDENKKYVKLRAVISELWEGLFRLDKESADIYSDIERLKGDLENYIKKSKATSFPNAKTLDQLDKIEDSVDSLEKELDSIEKGLKRAFARLQDISKETFDLTQKIAKYKKELKIVEAMRNAKRQEIINSISEEGKKFSDMKSTLDPDDLNVYNKARQAKVKMPILVPYNDGNCGGCGMEIESEVDSKLQEYGDIAECPNCRRLVFKK